MLRISACLVVYLCCFIFSGFIYANDIDDTKLLQKKLRLFLSESTAELDRNLTKGIWDYGDCRKITNKYIKESKAEILISALYKENFLTFCKRDTGMGRGLVTVVCKKEYNALSFKETFFYRPPNFTGYMHIVSIVVNEGRVVDVGCQRTPK